MNPNITKDGLYYESSQPSVDPTKFNDYSKKIDLATD